MRALLLLLLAAPAAAQTYRDTGSAFCICPSGKRGNVGRPQDDYKTCEEFCGMGAASGPSIDYGAIQRAEQEQRERREREAQAAAERKAKKAMEQRQFEADKADAVRSLKGVSTGEIRLKGVGAAPNELKGLDPAPSDPHGLKGLTPAREPREPLDEAGGGKGKCVPSASCSEALGKQADALESARKEQGDLYTAMATADMKHGWSMKGELFKAPPDAPNYYVWDPDAKDYAGFPTYLRAYKTTVDDISRLITAQRAAALNGAYDPKKKSLYESEGKRAKAELEKAKGKAKTIKEFAEYMKALKACAEGADADFNACVKKVTALYETGLKLAGVGVDKATKNRVKAAGDAYTKYAGRALDRAKDAADSASRCYPDCR